jgi:hypothetical protein
MQPYNSHAFSRALPSVENANVLEDVRARLAMLKMLMCLRMCARVQTRAWCYGDEGKLSVMDETEHVPVQPLLNFVKSWLQAVKSDALAL